MLSAFILLHSSPAIAAEEKHGLAVHAWSSMQIDEPEGEGTFIQEMPGIDPQHNVVTHFIPSRLGGPCAKVTPLDSIDGLNDSPSSCTILPGMLLIESLYYQNASKIGGTALAAYPMFRVRTGITKRLEFTLDTPSQVAESGLAGAGLYPCSRAGYGLKYAFAETMNSEIAIGLQQRPPPSRFTPSLTQAKYTFDLTGGFHLSQRLKLNALLGGTTSGKVGFQHIFPMVTAGLGIRLDERDELSVDLGTRFIARHTWPQSFGDISITRLVSPNLAVDVGLGTAFNPVSDTKAHYLAAGFNILR